MKNIISYELPLQFLHRVFSSPPASGRMSKHRLLGRNAPTSSDDAPGFLPWLTGVHVVTGREEKVEELVLLFIELYGL